MAKGGFPGGMGGMGGINMQQLRQQALRMQQDMAKKQEELAAREFEASAGGGVVRAVVVGGKQLKSIEIKPEAVDPDDVEMLQDLVLAAVNEALRAADEVVSAEMAKLTGGLGF